MLLKLCPLITAFYVSFVYDELRVDSEQNEEGNKTSVRNYTPRLVRTRQGELRPPSPSPSDTVPYFLHILVTDIALVQSQ